MSKHTPGPWTHSMADPVSNGHKAWVHAPSFSTGTNNSQPNGQFVAQVGSGLRGSAHLGRVTADARLIAAAPELLAALQLIVKTCAFQRGESPTFDVAIAAIAKATGEQR